MKIPTKEEALGLLKKHGIEGNVLCHVKKVNEVAMKIGLKLKEEGENVNISLLDAASLLHDIGKRLSDITDMNHIEAGVKILKDEGMPEIAEVISKHATTSLLDPDTEPKTWEEKIVYYADMRVVEDELVSLDERINYLVTRYPQLKKVIPKVLPKIKNIEKEIFKKMKSQI